MASIILVVIGLNGSSPYKLGDPLSPSLCVLAGKFNLLRFRSFFISGDGDDSKLESKLSCLDDSFS